MNYFELYPGDYLRDTTRLTLVEHGAYLRLLMTYYAEEYPLPADYDELFLIAGAIKPADKEAVRKIADRFFPLASNGLRHNGRADEEIAKKAKRMVGAQEKRGNENERQRRTRARRTKLFAELGGAGIVPDAMIAMADLKVLHAEHVTGDIGLTEQVVSRVTPDDVMGVDTDVSTASTSHEPRATITPDRSQRTEEVPSERAQLPPEVDQTRWDLFEAHHRAQRRGWSIARRTIAVGQLRALVARGIDPNPVLTWATARGLADLVDGAQRMAADAAKAPPHGTLGHREGLADRNLRRASEILGRIGTG